MKLLSPESLDDAQREVLRNYSRFFPTGAVCVNVVLGRDPWDIRPLVLMNGKVHIIRVSAHLDESQMRIVIADLEGFSVIFSSAQRVIPMAGEGRCLVVRPFVAETLQDILEKGELTGSASRQAVVQNLIKLVLALHRRNVAHGHISPSNVVTNQDGLALLDPIFGSLNGTQDAFLAPETSVGMVPQPSADLFSLGRIIKLLLGDTLTEHQKALVEQLLLASPRHRPPLVEVAAAFDLTESESPSAHSEPTTTPAKGSTGRLVKPRSARPIAPPVSPPAQPGAKPRGFPRTIVLSMAAIAVAVVVFRSISPHYYFSLVRHIPALANLHSSDFDQQWKSNDPAQMTRVAQAAVLDENPAAIYTISSDVLHGSNPKGVRTRLLRVALDRTWESELSQSDIHAALVVALMELVPEGLKQLPPLAELHPAVIVAIAAETEPSKANKELKAISVDKVTSLPAPFGTLFQQLKEVGYTSLGSPQAISLAAIATGDTRAQAFEGLLSSTPEAKQTRSEDKTIKLISIALPVIAHNPAAVSELLATLRAQGGDLAGRASWFEIEDIAGWSETQPIDQVKIILGTLPANSLDMVKYVDLLSFPSAPIREQAIARLKEKFVPASAERLLFTLASDANQLNREQSVALVSAIQERDETRRKQFIQKWFDLKPAPDTVLLVLLSRAHLDTNDFFNWEAASYLRKNSWRASFDVLKLLATHPIPSARVLAYGRLDPSIAAERDFLKQRLSVEKDPVCLKSLMEKLSVLPK